MHRGRSVGPARVTVAQSTFAAVSAALIAIALVSSAACSSEDSGSGGDNTTSTTAAVSSTTSADDGGAAPGPDRTGDAIVEDATLRIPGEDGAALVYEIRNLRITGATDQSNCPGGTPVNTQRLAAEITAYQVVADTPDVNVTPNDVRPPLPDVSMLPEIVLVGVSESSTPNSEWFVGINGQTGLVSSAPNTLLRPAPAASTTSDTCAIVGWQATDLAEPLQATELEVTSNAFAPKDFDPEKYQVRVGRGADYAYCWPLADLAASTELGQCR